MDLNELTSSQNIEGYIIEMYLPDRYVQLIHVCLYVQCFACSHYVPCEQRPFDHPRYVVQEDRRASARRVADNKHEQESPGLLLQFSPWRSTAVQLYIHVLRIRYNLFHRYRDLSTKIIVNKILTDSARSQSGARRTKFHREKLQFVQSATRTTKFHL